MVKLSNLTTCRRCGHTYKDGETHTTTRCDTILLITPQLTHYPKTSNRDRLDRVSALCWCAKAYVHIPAWAVGITTGTCGKPTCNVNGKEIA